MRGLGGNMNFGVGLGGGFGVCGLYVRIYVCVYVYVCVSDFGEKLVCRGASRQDLWVRI